MFTSIERIHRLSSIEKSSLENCFVLSTFKPIWQ